jgi:hypothetical protein
MKRGDGGDGKHTQEEEIRRKEVRRRRKKISR